MAFIVPLTVFPDTQYPESYARIAFVRAFWSETYVSVCWYADEAARQAGENPVQMQDFTVPTVELDNGIFASAYEWLKTLPEFAGAGDVPGE